MQSFFPLVPQKARCTTTSESDYLMMISIKGSSNNFGKKYRKWSIKNNAANVNYIRPKKRTNHPKLHRCHRLNTSIKLIKQFSSCSCQHMRCLIQIISLFRWIAEQNLHQAQNLRHLKACLFWYLETVKHIYSENKTTYLTKADFNSGTECKHCIVEFM